MTRKAVFLGDFNVDIIMDGMRETPQPDREIACDSFTLTTGASSCITATAYAHLGGEAWVGGLVGEDDFSAFMERRLATDGERTEGLCRDPAALTGVTVNLVQGTQRYQITYAGAMGKFSARHITDTLFGGLRHLHIAGHYQARALLPEIASLLARARAAGATTSMDCQWDPTERWEGLTPWLPLVDMLFANEQEALSMTGSRTLSEALAALASRTRCPVIKAGAQGAHIMVDGRDTRVPARAVEVVDTIGAGDNFDAAFLFASLEKGMAPATAAAFACAAASRSCLFRGGTDARSSFDDVLCFMETPA